MVSKPREVEGEENPFLPPPVDLDKIPLVDKDRLITDTIYDFYFSDLQSWLREVFLDQSDEIGLGESNLPLYLFPGFIISQNSPSNTKPIRSPTRRPSSLHLETSFSSSLPKILTR
jgi:hypothetical protein